MEVKAIRLATETDWLEQRETFENLEALCPVSPYLNWAYTHICWQTFTPDVPNWMILVNDDQDQPVAGTIWREFTHTGRTLGRKAIRSFDHIFFMRIPPLLIKPGHEDQVFEALLEANNYLRDKTKSHVISLYRLDPVASQALMETLDKTSTAHKCDIFTEAPWLVLEDDFEGWLNTKHKKLAKDLPRKLRRLKGMYGQEPVMERIQPHQLTDDEYRDCCCSYKDMFETSWQYQWQEMAEEVDNTLTNEFTRQAFDIWRSKYLLNFYFLKAADVNLAYFVTLEYEGKVDCLLTGYIPDCQKYSPGAITFVYMIRNCHQRGLTCIDLGGELLGWKEQWCNHLNQSLFVEWPLGGLQGAAWSMACRLKSR